MSAHRPKQLGDYTITTVSLGTGQHSVKLGFHVLTEEKVAVKVIEKYRLSSEEEKEAIVKETNALKKLKHENIIQLYEVYEDKSMIYLFMELALGGDLYEYVTKSESLEEREAARIFYQIIKALQFCHENSIVHRDLKPENILLDESKERIMISDFGFCDSVGAGAGMSDYCGSHCYAAPEVLLKEENYDGNKADIWSLGVILYFLLAGSHPFEGDQLQSVLLHVVSGKRKKNPDHFSKGSCDILSKLLTFEPNDRPKLEELANHEWLKAFLDDELSTRESGDSSVTSPRGSDKVPVQQAGADVQGRKERPKLLPADYGDKSTLFNNLMNRAEQSNAVPSRRHDSLPLPPKMEYSHNAPDEYCLTDSKMAFGLEDRRHSTRSGKDEGEGRVYIRRGTSPGRAGSSHEVFIADDQRGRKNVKGPGGAMDGDAGMLGVGVEECSTSQGKPSGDGENLFFRERKKFSFMDPREAQEAHDHVVENIMPSMNFKKEDVLESIRKNDHNAASATYHLLMRKMSRCSDASDVAAFHHARSSSFSAPQSPNEVTEQRPNQFGRKFTFDADSSGRTLASSTLSPNGNALQNPSRSPHSSFLNRSFSCGNAAIDRTPFREPSPVPVKPSSLNASRELILAGSPDAAGGTSPQASPGNFSSITYGLERIDIAGEAKGKKA
eukprot:Nk52_evm40s359 gene=Nk52_evmTU40s359